MTTVKARFDGRVFVPQEPVDLPVGYELDIPINEKQREPVASGGGRPLAQLAELLEQLPDDPDSPTDFAAQHDHYLYGTPKQECR